MGNLLGCLEYIMPAYSASFLNALSYLALILLLRASRTLPGVFAGRDNGPRVGGATAAGYDGGMNQFKFVRAHKTAVIAFAIFTILGYACARIRTAIGFDILVLMAGVWILVAIFRYQSKQEDDEERPDS